MSGVSIRRFYGTAPKKPPPPLYCAPDRPMAVRLSGVVDSWMDCVRGVAPETRLRFLNDRLATCSAALSAFDRECLPSSYKSLTRADLEIAEARVLSAIRITPTALEAA